jgi:hypothetical protein
MAKYNLINNGIVYTLTASGTGNKDLTNSQLSTLIDGVTVSGGVVLTASDVVYLETDLSTRIKVDEIRVYAEDLTALSDINFYYKNAEDDSYTICSKGVTTDYYYATIPGLSAPRYVLTTISGMESTLYEYIVYNDDYIIGFGADGTASAVYLDAAPVGEDSDAYPVTIFNNSTVQYPANAYVVIDYTGNAADYYVKIAATESGTYYDITDGFELTDDLVSSKYRWSQGTFNNTEIVNSEYIQISSVQEDALENKLCHIPAPLLGWHGQPWVYDSTDNVVYSIHYDSTLKLYKYDLTTYEWTYISWLPTYSLVFNITSVAMTKADNYIYLTFSAEELNTDWFGRYDLSGAQGNFTWLPHTTISMILANPCNALVAYNGYIYYGAGGSVAAGYCIKYEIATSIWTSCGYPDSNYYSTTEPIRCTLLADPVRNCLYFLVGRATTGRYIQRYDIATNTWNKTWFNFYDRLGVDFDRLNMDYYNGKIYFSAHSYGDVVHVYDIVTDTVSHIVTGYTMATTGTAGILVIPPQGSIDSEVTLLLSNIAGDPDGLYGYNINDSMFFTTLEENTGTYTSPIFDVEDKYNASYFLIEETTVDAMSQVSKDSSTAPGTIEVRSSDIAPTPIIKIYWPYQENTSYMSYAICDVVTNTVTMRSDTVGGSPTYVKAIAVNNNNGYKYLSRDYEYSNSNTYNTIRVYNIDEARIYELTTGFANQLESYFPKLVEFTYGNTLWGYTGYNYLAHLEIQNGAAMSVSQLLYTSVSNILSLSAEYDGTGAWYVDGDLSRVIHLSGNHIQLASVYALTTPYQVAASTGGTAWASDIGTSKIYLLDTNGAILKTVDTPKPLYEMTRDYRGGFFARASTSEGDIYHYTANGVMDMHITGQYSVYSMKGCPYGCVLFFNTQVIVKYIDLSLKGVSRTYSLPNYYTNCPDIFWCDLASSQTNFEEQGSVIIPQGADPVWSTLAWKEVPKNGYFLPKNRYHQARLTLQSSYSAINAKVNSINIQRPIKISDIQPGSGQDMYVKTAIPSEAALSDYSVKLKTWWDIQE